MEKNKDSKNEQAEVAQRLRSARETLGLTQEDVASALGIPRTSVIAMEAGKRNVTALELRRMARLYRREVSWLLGEGPESLDETSAEDSALFRATAQLSIDDKEQVLRFAQFLAAGDAPPVARSRPLPVRRGEANQSQLRRSSAGDSTASEPDDEPGG